MSDARGMERRGPIAEVFGKGRRDRHWTARQRIEPSWASRREPPKSGQSTRSRQLKDRRHDREWSRCVSQCIEADEYGLIQMVTTDAKRRLQTEDEADRTERRWKSRSYSPMPGRDPPAAHPFPSRRLECGNVESPYAETPFSRGAPYTPLRTISQNALANSTDVSLLE